MSKRNLYRVIRRGEISAVHVGGRTYIRDDELKRFVAALPAGTATEASA